MDLLSQWLKEEVGINVLGNLESHFASGYAFGELLGKFNLQNDFKHFEDGDSPDAMINNFTRLQPTFSKLKIKLDSSSASAIMNAEKGVAAKFVYEIKVAMDTFRKELSTGKSSYSQSLAVETKPSLALLETKVNSDRVKYTNKMHEIFEHNVRRKVPDPGTIREAVHLHKFSAERARQERKVEDTKFQTQRELDFRRKTFREDLLSKMYLRKQKGKDLEDSIIQSHSASMTHRRQLEKQELAIESALSRKREGFKLLANKTAGREARNGIDDFENTLKKLGIGEQRQDSALEPLNTSAEEQLRKIKGMVPDTSFWNTTKDDYMNTVKARVSEESTARKEREKKRKKLLLERQQAHVEEAQTRRNTMVISALTSKSDEEQRTQDRLSQLGKENQSMRENRSNLDRQNEDRHQQDLDLTLKREAEIQRKRLEEYRRETAEGEVRWTSLKEKALKEKKVRREAFARDLTLQLVELAEKVTEYREITNTNVPKSEYMNWVARITSGAGSNRQGALTSGEEAEEPDEIRRALDMSSVENYLNNRGEWDVGFPCESNEEVVKIISELSKEEDSPLEHTLGNMDSDFDLKVAVVGGFASGKSTLAAKLATKFNLHLIDVDKLVGKAVSMSAAPPQEEGEASAQDDKLVQLGKEIKTIMSQGKDVEDEYIVKLILLEISKIKEIVNEGDESLQGYVLDGFPCSKDQAALLEKYMTGLDLEKLKARKDSASKIAPPLDNKAANIDGTLVSGMDAVFRLSMDDESLALKRVLGKRVDPETQQVYHLEFNPPPVDDAGLVERLEEVENSIKDLSIIEARLKHFAEGKESLDGWLKMFSNLLHPIEAFKDIESIQETAGETLSNIFEEKKKAKEALVALESATKAEEAAKVAMEASIRARSACEEAAAQLLLAKKAEIEASSMLEANPEETDAKDVLSQKSAELCQTHFESVQKAAQESEKFAEEAQKAAESAKESADTCKSKTEDITLSTSARIEAQQSATSAEEASKSAAELAEKAQTELKAAEEATKKASKTLSSSEPEESPEENETTEATEGEQAESRVDSEVATKISQEAKSNLWKRWQCMEEMYISGMLQIFSKLREHRYNVLTNFVNVRESFQQFLNMPDKKQEIVAEFQMKFNSIDDDLRRRREAKAELLLRTDELCDTLWDICDKRKKEWMDEIQEIQSDSFVEDHSSLLLALFEAVCQLEMDRLAVTCSIIHDHHNAKAGLSHESHAEIDVPTITTFEDLPDKFKAAKPTDPEWIVEEMNESGLPGFQGFLSANIACIEYYTKSSLGEDAPEEIKEALEKEQHCAVQRLHRVATSALKYNSDLSTISNNIFELLKEWLNTRYVGSCSSVSALGETIREAARSGEKLLYSIKLEADQLVIDENVLVSKYREAPKSSLDTYQGEFQQLSSAQLRILSVAMKKISHSGLIRISDAIEVLIRFTKEHLGDATGVDSLKIHNALRIFEVEKTNHISCSHFLSCLLITTVPNTMSSNEREIMRAMREFSLLKTEDGLVTREEFESIKLWWEEGEKKEDEDKEVKMLWFDLFANENGKACFKKILSSMCMDHSLESVLAKITQVYSQHETGPDGELIARNTLKVGDIYRVIYPESAEPLKTLDATTFTESDVKSKLAECMDEDSKDAININKVVSSNGLAFLSKLLQVYIYKDFFSLLRL